MPETSRATRRQGRDGSGGHGPTRDGEGGAKRGAVGSSAWPSAFEVKDVNLYYGDFHAVQDMTMTIEPNKVTALIGSSGCGKTTVLRSLNRMHELDAGRQGRGRGHPR